MRYYLFLLLIFLFIPIHTCFAALGEPASSIDTDAKSFAVLKRAVIKNAAYTVHELSYDTGTLREYVSPDNVVFAVAWQGMTAPDLTHLLGAYTNEYQIASQKMRRIRGHRQARRVASTNILVEQWGHMRNRQGRAYVPALFPSGVTTDAIK